MKVKAVAKLNDGMSEAAANQLWKDIEGFAAYGFNASHSFSYTLLSYVCMYLKVYYPAEYFAGVLTVEKVEKRPAILEDMKRHGISLVMPNINHSTDVFTPIDDKTIACPFISVKGISSVATRAILEARKEGPFTSIEDLRKRVSARSCNISVIDKLDRVGAFADIENQPPANDQSRLKDQVELMEGLIDDHVRVNREIDFGDDETATALAKFVATYRQNKFDGDKSLSCPCPFIGTFPKMAVVVDSPSRDEESADVMGSGIAAESISQALQAAGADLTDIYYTSFFKTVKPKSGGYSNAYHAEASKLMQEEMSIIKPPLIVAMGQESAKFFVPNMPGKFAENEGRVFYDATNDWNVLIGMNPNRVVYDDSKQANIDSIIAKAVSITESK